MIINKLLYEHGPIEPKIITMIRKRKLKLNFPLYYQTIQQNHLSSKHYQRSFSGYYKNSDTVASHIFTKAMRLTV